MKETHDVFVRAYAVTKEQNTGKEKRKVKKRRSQIPDVTQF